MEERERFLDEKYDDINKKGGRETYEKDYFAGRKEEMARSRTQQRACNEAHRVKS